MSGILTGLALLFRPVADTPHFVLAIAGSVVVFVATMWGLHLLSPQARKWLTIALTFVAGLFYLLEFLWPTSTAPNGKQENFLTPFLTPSGIFLQNIWVWAVGMGIISLTIVHGRRLFARREGWHNSLAFFLAMISITVFGFMSQEGSGGPKLANLSYNALFDGLLVNLDSAMFALLAFYIASAAYRAFRIRTVESGLLMIAALVVMLGFVSFGVGLTSWIPPNSPWGYLRFEQLTVWLLRWINMPTQRAVTVGVSVGGLAMAMRLWLSLERGSFFSQEG